MNLELDERELSLLKDIQSYLELTFIDLASVWAEPRKDALISVLFGIGSITTPYGLL
jgi:hypothetical protein